jgi:hypothetical protein
MNEVLQPGSPGESKVKQPGPPGIHEHTCLIDRSDLARRLSVGVSTLDRLRAANKVGPREIKFGGVRFLLPEVIAWIATPCKDGSLHDASSWPPIWAVLQKARS